MAQYQESTPHEERQSKNLSVWSFLKETAPAVLLTLAGGISVGIGQFIGDKDIAAKRKVAGVNSLGVNEVVSEFTKKFRYPLKAKIFTWVGGAAMAAATYLMWRKEKKEDLDVQDIYGQYKEARAMRMDNDAITKDNAVLRKMVAYEERQLENPKHVQEILDHGPRAHAEHAAAESPEMTATR